MAFKGNEKADELADETVKYQIHILRSWNFFFSSEK